jgi:PPK2 family polyphosphate:nucleotide phosphotransferase
VAPVAVLVAKQNQASDAYCRRSECGSNAAKEVSVPYSVPVEPGTKVNLAKIDPAADGGLSKAEGVERTARLIGKLDDLQQELYAAGVHSVLVVLQGMDTSGKDGTIRKVFSGVNPQGCQVTSFKAPNEDELDHDFLWRIHRHTPAKGMLGVFNRSHYEDVLIVRVHDLVPRKVWKQRYQHINDFERLLVDNGTIVCKFFLHISKHEQEQRLIARQRDVEKAYKLSPADWKERDRWDDYMAAYEEALRRCSTAEAPWTIVPADRKWYRNLAIAEALVERLERRRGVWRARLRKLSQERLAELAEFHAAEELVSPNGQKDTAPAPA